MMLDSLDSNSSFPVNSSVTVNPKSSLLMEIRSSPKPIVPVTIPVQASPSTRFFSKTLILVTTPAQVSESSKIDLAFLPKGSKITRVDLSNWFCGDSSFGKTCRQRMDRRRCFFIPSFLDTKETTSKVSKVQQTRTRGYEVPCHILETLN